MSDHVRNAVELKNALESVPFVVPSIGNLQKTDKRWKKVVEAFHLMREKELVFMSGSSFLGEKGEGTIKINYQDVKFEGPVNKIPREVIQKLCQTAPISGYGNQQTLTTEYDTKVKEARELTTSHFDVSQGVIARVAELWEKNHMMPAQVEVVPYKVNLYGPEGHFKEHRDTPATNMVGTFLLGLGEPSPWEKEEKEQDEEEQDAEDVEEHKEEGREGGDKAEQVKEDETYHLLVNKEHEWTGTYANSYCAFYCDVPHLVARKKAQFRATLAFKVYAKKDHPVTTDRLEEREHAILEHFKEWKEAFGILCYHRYTVKDISLKGNDGHLLQLLQSLPDRQVITLPVLLVSRTRRGKVFPLTEECLAFALSKKFEKKHGDFFDDHYGNPHSLPNYDAKGYTSATYSYSATSDSESEDEDEDSKDQEFEYQKKDATSLFLDALHKQQANIPFYQFQRLYAWINHYQDEIEHTGNESRSESEDSLYVAQAILCVPKSLTDTSDQTAGP
jgi:hypothetical protein